MTPYELLLEVLAAGTNVDGRMGTNGVPLRAVTPPPSNDLAKRYVFDFGIGWIHKIALFQRKMDEVQ